MRLVVLLLLTGCVRLAPRCDAPLDGFLDADGDGYGEGAIDGCAGDAWIAAVDGDCDDAHADASPDGVEAWYDGIDGDCDGADDYDQDADGYVANDYGGDDCDDTRDDVSPGRTEIAYNGVDDACDGGDDYDQDGDGDRAEEHGGADCDDTDATVSSLAEESWYDGIDQDCGGGTDYDQDGDGWAPDAWAGQDGLPGGDCDDLHADANPEGVEDCDGVDDDCDGAVDEDFDVDGDGYAGCVEDCDDTDATVFPGATETCDGVDQDCDGASDEDFDLDGDGFATCRGDCDDADGAVNPGAEEVWYDGIDQDCDGASDDDQDGDGSDRDVDCDDTDAALFPGAREVAYDGVDQDCDGADLVDVDGDGWDGDAVGGADCDDEDDGVYPGARERWYDGVDQDCDGASDYDQDGDGHDVDTFAGGDDCDDTAAAIHPGAAELWYDGVDQDCDGASDDDQDGDGYDVDSAAAGDDCDDTDAAIHPGAADVLDGVDDDCTGVADDPAAEDVAIAVVRGESASQAAGGGGVALDADLDGDGEDELVLSSATDGGGGADAGAVWVFGWSELGDVGVSDAWLTLEGAAGDEVGAAFATGLDWTDDGVGDLAVGAPGTDALYLVEPASASSVRHAASTLDYATITGTASTRFGAAVCSGDLDGDGVSDLTVGATAATSGKGAVYLFLGGSAAASMAVGSADYGVVGADSGDAIGAVLACDGDVSGDGRDDLAVGVPNDDENGRTNSGSVFLVLGSAYSVYLPGFESTIESADAWTLTGSAASEAVGTSVAIADVSGTANADLVVGATGYAWSGGTGGVGVYQGSSSGSESFTAADRLVRGAGGLGSAVGASADLDGDGTNDLLLGAGTGDTAYLVSLALTAGTLDLPGDQLARFDGAAGGLGAAVSADARDLDGDGVDEVAVAAPDDAGAVYVLNAFP